MKMMMKSAFMKSNVKLAARILSVATLIESCETESSCSSSITDSTNNVKNSELDENHPTLVKQDMRRFSSLKHEQSFPWLNYSCIRSGYLCKYCEHFQTDPTNSSILYVNCGVDLGTHPTRKLEYHNESIKHKQSVEKFNNAKITELTISKK